MEELNTEKLVEGIITSGALHNQQGFFNPNESIDLFFNKANGKYYTDAENLICKVCGDPIREVVIFRANFNLQKMDLCCMGCLNTEEEDWQRGIKGYHNIMGIAIITDSDFVKNLKPHFLRMPSLQCKNSTSVTDIKVMENSEIIDNTVHAGKVNFDHQLDARVKRRELDFEEENFELEQKLETERVKNVLALTNQDDYFNSEEDLAKELNQHLNSEIIVEENLIEDKSQTLKITDERVKLLN